MIHRYSMKTQYLWEKGELQVQIFKAGFTRPIAYCDGTDEDIMELTGIAEEEGAELPSIHRRVLKTGREIWTMGEMPVAEFEDEDDD